jgi:hypothetical protein
MIGIAMKDHDDAVRRENLVVVLGRQITLPGAGGQRLLRTHHDGVGEAAQQHHQRQDAIHHADALVIDGSQPLAPQIRPMTTHRDPEQDKRMATIIRTDASSGIG